MAKRRSTGQPRLSGDVLPLDLLLHANPDLFAAFTRVLPDGRLGVDHALNRRQMAAAADLRVRFEAWFEDRGISTKYLDYDPRFEAVLAASRAHWGLNHQGVASNK